MRFIDRHEVARRLTYETCIPVVRDAMIAFSNGSTKQMLRSILPLSEGRLFGLMAGAMSETGPFGAKVISVLADQPSTPRQSHQGLVALFDPFSGAPVCVVEAGEITAMRTAAASAVATDALARQDASRLAILGYGEQARTHARAIGKVRTLQSIGVWGRSQARAQAFAEQMAHELALPVTAHATARAASADADIICTVTAAREPILQGAWVAPGTHVNIVGSSYAGPTEVDDELVVCSRFFVDSREGVLAQGAEFLNAKARGLIGEDHIVGEIGQVLAGEVAGRISAGDVTAYKSLGHIVQDLAVSWAIYSQSP